MNVIARICPVAEGTWRWNDGNPTRSWRVSPGAIDCDSARGMPVLTNHRGLSNVGTIEEVWQDSTWYRAVLNLDPRKIPIEVLAHPRGIGVSVALDGHAVGAGDDQIFTHARITEISVLAASVKPLHRDACIEGLAIELRSASPPGNGAKSAAAASAAPLAAEAPRVLIRDCGTILAIR
jgi:hypothetical protein